MQLSMHVPFTKEKKGDALMQKNISQESLNIILKMQQNELNESYIYREIAQSTKDAHNKETLLRLANEEEAHYKIWKTYSNKEMKPNYYNDWDQDYDSYEMEESTY